MIVLLMALALAVQDDAAADEAIAAYDAAYLKTKEGERAALVRTLAQTKHEKVVPKLSAALAVKDKTVRLAAVQGLGGFADAAPALRLSATKALVAGINLTVNATDLEMKDAILANLGPLKDEFAVTTIKISLDDKSLKITATAVTAAVALRSKDLIQPLISLLKESEKTLKAAANPTLKGKKAVSAKKDANDPEELKVDRAANIIPSAQAALETLTGQKNANGEAWDAWWTKARPNFTLSKD